MPPGGHITSDSDLESVISLQVEKPKSRRNSVGEKYFCSVEGCKQSFRRLDHLDRHEYKHTGILDPKVTKMVVIKIAAGPPGGLGDEKRATALRDFHQRNNGYTKKHACHYEGCSKIYSILTHLKRHIRTTHERPNIEPNKNIPCEVDTCDKMFTSLTNMSRHIREVHENPKVYKCQFCEEKFSQKLKMRRHEISKHTGVFPHTCDKCSKGFYQKWQWEKHEETCKIYPCLTCSKKFDKWTLFIKHCKEAQHGRKYYKCEYCESAYIKPSDLQKHVAAKHISEYENKNSGEYKCPHVGCERAYAYERNLRQHISTAHEGKTFDCTEEDCDKVFSSLQNLQKHIKRDHSLDAGDADNENKTKKKKPKSAKRKKRKDAGISKISTLVSLSGIAVDKDLNTKLKSRDTEALETVAAHLSQDMELDDTTHSELETNIAEKCFNDEDHANGNVTKDTEKFDEVNTELDTIVEETLMEVLS